LVQADGSIPEEYRGPLGDRIYGCDDCQEVCPPSRRSPEGELPADPAGSWVDLLELLGSTDQELLDRHGRWYIARRDPRNLRRNALIALGNVADPDDGPVRSLLGAHAAGRDPMLAEHAAWALTRLDDRRVSGSIR
jgi:epoxyqueuosine reductase